MSARLTESEFRALKSRIKAKNAPKPERNGIRKAAKAKIEPGCTGPMTDALKTAVTQSCKYPLISDVLLPLPPSVNHYWQPRIYIKNGRRIRGRCRSERALAYIEAVKALIGGNKYGGIVCAVIKIFFPDNRERDIDNTLKATFDALAHAGVIASDNQIKLLLLGDSLERVQGGAVEVSVWAL